MQRFTRGHIHMAFARLSRKRRRDDDDKRPPPPPPQALPQKDGEASPDVKATSPVDAVESAMAHARALGRQLDAFNATLRRCEELARRTEEEAQRRRRAVDELRLESLTLQRRYERAKVAAARAAAAL